MEVSIFVSCSDGYSRQTLPFKYASMAVFNKGFVMLFSLLYFVPTCEERRLLHATALRAAVNIPQKLRASL